MAGKWANAIYLHHRFHVDGYKLGNCGNLCVVKNMASKDRRILHTAALGVMPGEPDFMPKPGRCGGSVKVIACIEDQETIDQILFHLCRQEQEAPSRPLLVPPTRAPPGTRSLFVEK